jgi:hypothetical protein
MSISGRDPQRTSACDFDQRADRPRISGEGGFLPAADVLGIKTTRAENLKDGVQTTCVG